MTAHFFTNWKSRSCKRANAPENLRSVHSSQLPLLGAFHKHFIYSLLLLHEIQKDTQISTNSYFYLIVENRRISNVDFVSLLLCTCTSSITYEAFCFCCHRYNKSVHRPTHSMFYIFFLTCN
jgi:hypothetical protein